MRVSYNGITCGCQSHDAGSIPATRSKMSKSFESNLSPEKQALISWNLRLMSSQMLMIADIGKLSKITAFIDTRNSKILAFNKTTEWPFHPNELIPETPDPLVTKPIVFFLNFDEKTRTYTEIMEPEVNVHFSDNAKMVVLESIQEWNRKTKETFKDFEDLE